MGRFFVFQWHLKLLMRSHYFNKNVNQGNVTCTLTLLRFLPCLVFLKWSSWCGIFGPMPIPLLQSLRIPISNTSADILCIIFWMWLSKYMWQTYVMEAGYPTNFFSNHQCKKSVQKNGPPSAGQTMWLHHFKSPVQAFFPAVKSSFNFGTGRFLNYYEKKLSLKRAEGNRTCDENQMGFIKQMTRPHNKGQTFSLMLSLCLLFIAVYCTAKGPISVHVIHADALELVSGMICVSIN